MKLYVKIITLLLAICCLATAFVACDSEEQNTENEQTATTEESTTAEEKLEVHPTITKKNYNDECYVHVFERVQLLYTEEGEDDVMTEALFSRQEKLHDYLGVDLVGIQTGNLNVYGTDFTTAVKNKDGSVDVLVCSAYVSIADFILQGYLRKYNDLEGINLDADYWKTDYMEEVMIEGDTYLGYSDFNIFNTHVISFNKKMLEQYSDALDESLYDSVRNYRWTVDKMISLANLVYIDATADGKSADDTFGISGNQWIPFIGFLHASNIPLVEENEKGDYQVSVYNEKYQEKTTALVDKLHALSKSDSAWFKYRIEDTPLIPMTSGRTLMYIEGTGGLVKYLDYDIDFGVVPFPMFDESQKDVGYRSFNYDGFITFPSYMRNESMSVETIELLSFFSEPVQTAYYEKQLGKQVADVPDDREMLQIVWDGICTDFGLAYSYVNRSLDKNLYMLPVLTHANTTENIASYVKSYERTANTALIKWVKSYKAKQ